MLANALAMAGRARPLAVALGSYSDRLRGPVGDLIPLRPILTFAEPPLWSLSSPSPLPSFSARQPFATILCQLLIPPSIVGWRGSMLTLCLWPLPLFPSEPISTSTYTSRRFLAADSALAFSFFLSRLRILGAMDDFRRLPYRL